MALTPDEFENGVNTILDNTKKRGQDGSEGLTKSIFKLIIRKFKELYKELIDRYYDAFLWEGVWATGKAYVKGSVVRGTSGLYRAKIAHTSSASITFTNTTYWDKVIEDGSKGDMGNPSAGHVQILNGDTDPPASISTTTVVNDLYIDTETGTIWKRVAALETGWTPFIVNPTNVYWKGIANAYSRNASNVEAKHGNQLNVSVLDYSTTADSLESGKTIRMVMSGVCLPNNQPVHVEVIGYLTGGAFDVANWSAIVKGGGPVPTVSIRKSVLDRLTIYLGFNSFEVTKFSGEITCNMEGPAYKRSKALRISFSSAAPSGTLLGNIPVRKAGAAVMAPGDNLDSVVYKTRIDKSDTATIFCFTVSVVKTNYGKTTGNFGVMRIVAVSTGTGFTVLKAEDGGLGRPVYLCFAGNYVALKIENPITERYWPAAKVTTLSDTSVTEHELVLTGERVSNSPSGDTGLTSKQLISFT